MESNQNFSVGSQVSHPDSQQAALNLIQYLLNVYYDVASRIQSYPIPACEAAGMRKDPEKFKTNYQHNCNCILFDNLLSLAQFQTKLSGLKSVVFDDCKTLEKLYEFLCRYDSISVCGNVQNLNTVRVQDTKNALERIRFTEIDFEQLANFSSDKSVDTQFVDIIRVLCIYLIIESFNNDVFSGLLYLLGNYGKANELTESFLKDDFIQGNYLYVSGKTSIGQALYRCVRCYIKIGFYPSKRLNVSIISTIYRKIKYQT